LVQELESLGAHLLEPGLLALAKLHSGDKLADLDVRYMESLDASNQPVIVGSSPALISQLAAPASQPEGSFDRPEPLLHSRSIVVRLVVVALVQFVARPDLKLYSQWVELY
jgi:hypothetical protein